MAVLQVVGLRPERLCVLSWKALTSGFLPTESICELKSFTKESSGLTEIV